jgi:ankyrin repeat protein
LERGADPNTKWDEDSLLYETMFQDSLSAKKHEKIVLALIDHGADVNYRNPFTWNTALTHGISLNEYQVAEALLKKGADPNAPGNPDVNYASTVVHELGSIGFNGSDHKRANMLKLFSQYHAS